jgi:hypothetical protein
VLDAFADECGQLFVWVWLGVDDFGVVVGGVVVDGVVVVVVLLVVEGVVVGLAGVELWTAATAPPLPAVRASASAASRMVCLGLRMSPPSRRIKGHACIQAGSVWSLVSLGCESDKTPTPGVTAAGQSLVVGSDLY